MSRSKLVATSLVVLGLTLPLAASAQSGGEAAPPAPPPLPPGTFQVPGTDTTIRVYGFVEIDGTYDFHGRTADINNYDWASVIFVQPLDNSAQFRQKRRQFFLTARSSRIGVSTTTPTALGNLVTKVEGDFLAPNPFMGELATNSTGFRIRHAYGEVGGLLVGQTWSNFTDLGSFPDTVDFNPPGAAVLLRQTMIRYAFNLGPASLSLALENPQSLHFANEYDELPDLTANFTLPQSWGHLSLRGVTHEFRSVRRSKRAYGGGLSGSVKIGNDTLVASVQGGEGIGRYMFNALLQGGFDTGTDLMLWQAVGYHVGFTHVWSPQLRSNVIWSQTFFGENAVLEDAQRDFSVNVAETQDFIPNRRVDQLMVNTLWSFVKNAEVGLEYSYGLRQTFGPESGKQHRLNALFRFGFY